ncbi:MAG: OmpA family protein [Candidatus Babeliales bacterium]|jgi:outer membrane protein OmpA-like peptidoglycan-associated protein
MKKCIFLTLAMLISLPGCWRKKSKMKNEPQKIAMQNEVDVFSSIDIPLAQDGTNEEETNIALNDNDSDTVRSFFDEEIGEFESSEELSIAMNAETEEKEQALEKFSWVDAAVKENDEEEFKAIYFSWDSDEVHAEQAESVAYDIGQTKEELKVSQKTGIEPTIVIEGHSCHAAGSPAYNLALSEKRAKKIADRFVDAGIDRNNIKIVGRGQDAPAIVDGEKITGSREEQWPNRRVEVRMIYS